MRRKPTVSPQGQLRPERALGPNRPPAASDLGDAISPFLVSGGQTVFIDLGEGPVQFHPAGAGVQLVTYVYIPRGHVGFVKELRVAPFMPPILTDPWTGGGAWIGAVTPSWRGYDALGPDTIIQNRAGGTNGVWTTPFGWESYFDATGPNGPPSWRWHLVFLQGDAVGEYRRAHGPLNLGDPATWYLLPDIAVPASAYPNGIPGAAPSGQWGAQRMQVIQGDKLNSHVLCPEDTTIALFTAWTQSLFQPRAVQAGAPDVLATYGAPVYPLLPSFGQLHGYSQAVQSDASRFNARFGWGG